MFYKFSLYFVSASFLLFALAATSDMRGYASNYTISENNNILSNLSDSEAEPIKTLIPMMFFKKLLSKPLFKKNSIQYRPVAKTVNPDLLITNIPLCESNLWLSGMSVVGNGKVTHYVDYKHKDKCFIYEVEILPEDVDSRNEAQVFKHLGSTEFDVYKYRPS